MSEDSAGPPGLRRCGDEVLAAFSPPVRRLVGALERRRPATTPWPAPPHALGATGGPRDAAVVAILAPPAFLLHVERPVHLATHGGQVAFPGGKPEPGDASLEHAALREVHEEVGIAPAALRVVGELDPVATPSAFLIRPFVAIHPTPLRTENLRLEPGEVAEAWTVDLADLMAPGAHRTFLVRRGEHRFPMHEFRVPARGASGRHADALRIWGATGRMTAQLVSLAGAELALDVRSAPD